MPTLDRFQEALALIPSLLSVSDVLCRHTSSLAWSIVSLASEPAKSRDPKSILSAAPRPPTKGTTSSRSSRQHTLARQLLVAFVVPAQCGGLQQLQGRSVHRGCVGLFRGHQRACRRIEPGAVGCCLQVAENYGTRRWMQWWRARECTISLGARVRTAACSMALGHDIF